MVVEEWPGTPAAGNEARGDSSREYQLILLSAKTPTALEQITTNLRNHLTENPTLNLADVAYTLQEGRKAFKYRRMLVCADLEEAVNHLAAGGSAVKSAEGRNRPVIFMFPGQSAQYVNMGKELYEKEPVFRQQMDRCFEILEPLMDCDLKEILYPVLKSDKSDKSDISDQSDQSDKSDTSDKSDLHRTEITQRRICGRVPGRGFFIGRCLKPGGAAGKIDAANAPGENGECPPGGRRVNPLVR